MYKKFVDRLLGNTLYFKVLWAILVLLKMNPIISRMTSPLFIFLIIYGSLIIFYDIFGDVKTLQNKYSIFLLMFLVFIGISTIINYKNGLIDNIKYFISIAIQFIVIGRIDLNRSRDDIAKEMGLINKIIITGVTLASLISLWLILFGLNGSYEVASDSSSTGKLLYYYGVAYGGRLVGIYSNPNRLGAFVTISIICSIINLGLFKNRLYMKVIYLFSIIINFICLILSGSRSSILALHLCAFITVFLLLVYKNKNVRDNFRKYLKILVASSICILMLYSSVVAVRKVLTNVLENIERHQGESQVVLNLDRTIKIDKSNIEKVSSGRLTIWQAGLNTAKLNPVFGVGGAKLDEIVINNWNGNRIPSGIEKGGLHNIYLETLVSYGLPTFLILICFLIILAIDFIKNIFTILHEDQYQYFLGLYIIAMIGLIASNNLFESMILYFTNLASFVFVLYMGYAMYFTQWDSSNKGDNMLYRIWKNWIRQLRLILRSEV